MTRRFNILDIETDGEDPPAAILEIASTIATLDDDAQFDVGGTMSSLFGLPGGQRLNPDARAVHHITQEEIAGKLPCDEATLKSYAIGPGTFTALVAHNCAFEEKFIPFAITAGYPWVCTYKVALRVFPTAPRHSNQFLRYWLEDSGDLPALGDAAMPAHRAAPDTVATAHLFGVLLNYATVEQMIAWTKEPRLLPFCPIGEHKGKPWKEVPYDFLNWMVTKARDMDVDLIWNAKTEIDLRKARSF